MDIEIKEIDSMKTRIIGLTAKGKDFLRGKKTKFDGVYCWANANDIGYDAEAIGMSVKWLA